MENLPDKEPTPGKLARLNLYILGFALFATLIAGVAIGLLISRPVVVQDTAIVVTATPGTNVQSVAQTASETSSSPTTAQAEDKSNASPPTPTIMDFVLSDARHFQGSSDAPITLVEFSDFK